MTTENISLELNYSLVRSYKRLWRWFIVVAGLLVLSLLTIIALIWHNAKMHDERFNDARKANAVIASINRQLVTLSDRITKDSISRASEIGQKKVGLFGIKSTKSRLRPKISSDSATVAFAIQTDLEELAFDTLLASTEEAFQAHVIGLKEVIALSYERESQKDTLIQILTNNNQILHRDLKRQKFKTGIFKALWGITLVGGVVLLSKTD